MIERRRLVRLAALAALPLFSSCDKSPTAPRQQQAGPPAQLEKVSGDQQQGVVGTRLAAPLVVRITDANGRPVAGQIVNFRVVSGGGTVFAGAASTNADGVAQELWTLGTSTALADSQRVEVRAVDNSTGQPLVFAVFRATALPGAPATLAVAQGSGQAAPVGHALPDSLVARLADQYGNPIAGDTIRWSATQGGTIDRAFSVTDSAGRAAARWTLGTRYDSAGVATARFTSGSIALHADFTASAQLPADARLVVVAGDQQRDTAAARLSDSVVVRLTTASGQPIAGVPVTWIPGAGGFASPWTSTTNSDGRAATSWQLGDVGGSQVLLAKAGEAQASAQATASPRATAINVVRGQGQSGTLGSALADSLVVRLVDRTGAPVPGQRVTWSTSDGSTLSAAETTTGDDGRAAVRWTLGSSLAAPATATARYQRGSLVLTATFNATKNIPSNAVLAKVSGDQQTDSVNKVLSDSVVVRLTLADGRAVEGATVTWAPSSGGAAGSPTTVTDASGRTATTWRLGAVRGPETLQASAGPVSTTFSATAIGARPVTVSIASGRLQVALPSAALPAPVEVLVVDSAGHPAQGETVSFAVARGGGSVGAASAVTDANGHAQVIWTLGPQPGDNVLEARAGASKGQALASGALRWSTVAIGWSHSCGITTDGVAYCWGSSYAGARGDGTMDPENGTAVVTTPRRVVGGIAFTKIVVGLSTEQSCGLTADGAAYCWGDNYYGTLGTGDTVSVAAPTRVAGGLHFRNLSIGFEDACGVTVDHVGYCWGSDPEGHGALGSLPTKVCPPRAGTGGFPCTLVPTAVSGGLAFDTIAAGNEVTCGITTAAAAYCWGNDYSGSLGDGTNTDSHVPVAVAGGYTFKAISGGYFGSCGLRTDGAVMCWGDPLVENRDRTTTNTPQPFAEGTTFTSLVQGPGFVCGTTTTATTRCFGLDKTYQLGGPIPAGAEPCKAVISQGPCTRTPLLVGPYTSSSAQNSAACALAADGQAFCWGSTFGNVAIFGSPNGQANLPTPLRGPDTFAQSP